MISGEDYIILEEVGSEKVTVYISVMLIFGGVSLICFFTWRYKHFLLLFRQLNWTRLLF